MAVGKLIRTLAGPLERPICHLYRAVFVNVAATAKATATQIPQGARVLDVGGGDGTVVNALLRIRPDLQVVMLDLSPSIGRFLDANNAHRVTLHPATPMSAYEGASADVVLLSDVVHHVPPEARATFFDEARALVRPGGRLIVKDVEPGSFRSWLNLMADKHISGERGVSHVSHRDLAAMIGGQPEVAMATPSNYVVAFQL